MLDLYLVKILTFVYDHYFIIFITSIYLIKLSFLKKKVQSLHINLIVFPYLHPIISILLVCLVIILFRCLLSSGFTVYVEEKDQPAITSIPYLGYISPKYSHLVYDTSTVNDLFCKKL